MKTQHRLSFNACIVDNRHKKRILKQLCGTQEKRQGKKSNIPYNNPLLTHLYIDCKIVDRVVKAWEENEGEEPRRKGYMGHLTRIANTMVCRSRFLNKLLGRIYNKG